MELWKELIGGKDVITINAAELYFEGKDFDGFIERLNKEKVDYVHAVKVCD